jgi:two-component system, cell cycle sensor histidine kinase and response regulator CckA
MSGTTVNTSTDAPAPDLFASFLEAGGNAAGENLRGAIAGILDALPDAIVILDTQRQIRYANATATALFRKRGTPLGNSPTELQRGVSIFHPSSQTPIRPELTPLSRALRGEVANPAEYRVRREGRGVSTWMECGARPILGSDGEIRGAVVSARDITERKKRELALGSEHELRDFIYQGNLAGILHTTVDGRVVNCNDAMMRMLGYPAREELGGMRAAQMYYEPADRDRMLKLIRGPGHLTEYEICFRRRDNSRCWGLANIRFLDPATGEVGGTLISTVIDISERKRWEETLRQSEQRFIAFMRHLPGVAFIKDLAGRYVYYNDACWPLFNKRPEDVVGKTDDALWIPEHAALYRANDAIVVETCKPLEVTEPVFHLDGLHSWLIYKFPVVEDGRVVLVCGIGIDITERQTLEEQLTQARKMEALGRLAGGVAHDFNNVLTVISGYGQLALEEAALNAGITASDRITTYLQEILSSARRAVGLTGQLLAFSRRQVVQLKVLDLGELIRAFEQLLQRTLGEQVDLTVRYGRERCLIEADANQVEQLLMNLAVNARDAMPIGGSLIIECRLLAEPIERPGMKPLAVLLEMRDNGIGMDDNVKSRLFEPFFTSKDKAKGTGLGLSMAYSIVKQAGGEIEVESELNVGSAFRIYFPFAEGELIHLAPRAPAGIASGLETVLLVEDEESVRIFANTMLRRLGYQVLVADGGHAALEIWKQWSDTVDILLTDVIMPQMSGGELAHKLRAFKPGLKILFMSGYTDDMLTSHGQLTGETQLIQKPFSGEDLAQKLRDVLDA